MLGHDRSTEILPTEERGAAHAKRSRGGSRVSRVQGAAGLTLPDALLRLGSRALMGPPRARQGPAPLVVAPSRSRETLVRESGTPSPCPSPGRSGVSPAGGGGWSHAGSVSRGKAGASPLRPFLSLVSGMALRCLTPRASPRWPGCPSSTLDYPSVGPCGREAGGRCCASS